VEAEDFWLEDRRPGRVHGGPLEAMWRARFETAGQVRAFPSYRGQRDFAGWYWAATCADLVGYESWVELGHLMRLDADPDVMAVVSQPFRLSWRHDIWNLPPEDEQHAIKVLFELLDEFAAEGMCTRSSHFFVGTWRRAAAG